MLSRWASVTLGLGCLALAGGSLLVLTGLLLEGPSVQTPAGAALALLLGNVTLGWIGAGLYLLDAGDKDSAIRKFTLPGWGLILVTANAMAGLALGLAFYSEYAWWLSTGRTAILAEALWGGMVFTLGWFVLSRFGIQVWRSRPPRDPV